MEIFDTLANNAIELSSSPALIDDERTISWRDLSGLVDRLCLGIVHAGMRRGKHVIILTSRTRHQPLAMLAVMRGGGIATPLAGAFGAPQLCRLVGALAPTILIYDEAHADLACELSEHHEFRAMIAIGEPLSASHATWQDIENTEIEGSRFPVLAADTVVMNSVGCDSEGAIRACRVTLEQAWRAAGIVNRSLKVAAGSRLLDLFPSGILAHETMFRAIQVSGACICTSSTRAADVISATTRHGVQTLIAPAHAYHALCDALAGTGSDWNPPRTIEARGHVPVQLSARIRAVLGRELLPTWGTPETVMPVLGSAPGELGAPAQPLKAMSGIDDRICDTAGEELPEKAVGELLLAADTISAKAIDQDGEERDLLDPDGWFHSGALARRHGSGEIEMLGSRFDVFLRDGKRVYLGALSAALERMDGVREAAAALLDEGAGSLKPLLAVVLEPGEASGLDSASMMEYLWEQLLPHEIPEDVIIVDRLPRRPDGELDRPALQNTVTEALGEAG